VLEPGQAPEPAPVGLGAARPQADGQQHGVLPHAVGQERQEAHGIAVGPLPVVDHQDERRLGGQVGDQPVEGVEAGEARVVRVAPDSLLSAEAERRCRQR
jgi:hypothetical protein